MDIEAKRILKSTCYYYGASFANFPHFFNAINNKGDFENDIKEYNWRYKLYREELERLKKLSIDIIDNKQLHLFGKVGYKNSYNRIIQSLNKIFPISEWPELFIVEELPVKGNEQWESMSIDVQDEQYWGIKKGLYYQARYLTHCYFEFVIAHELIHWIISSYSKEYYPFVSLYEEGICDLFAAIALNDSGILSLDAIKNLFLYNRHLKSDDSIWKNYSNFFSYIVNVSMKYGIGSIITLIKQGRKAISYFDICNTKTDSNSFKEYDIKILLTELIEISSYHTIDIDSYIVLLALFEFSNQYISYEKISDIIKIPKDICINTIMKLNDLGYIFLKDGNIYQPNGRVFKRMKFTYESLDGIIKN